MEIYAADDPRGDCKEPEGGFILAVSPHHVADSVLHAFTAIPTAGGVASAAAAAPRIEAAGVAASHNL